MIMSELEDLNEFIKSGDPEMNYKGIEKMCDILIKKGGSSKVGDGSKVGENTLNNPISLNNPSHTPSLKYPFNTPSHLNTPILDLINRNLNNPKSLYFLIKLAYLKNIQISPCFLNFNYLPLFFYSSLISNDKQSIYNSSLLFLKSSYEKVYHILLFQESLLDFVDYENSNYLIYEEDPFYIKTQKVKMLFYKLDDISIYELTRQSKGELREVILENGLKKGFIIEGVLEGDMGGNDKGGSRVGLSKDKGFRNLPSTNTHTNPYTNIINILFYNFPFSLNYSYLIKNYLLSINPFTLNQDSFKKYLYLVGKVCDDYEIIDLDKIRDIDLITPILKFYISFFKRKILSEEKFIEIIRGLKKKEKFKEKAKVLLNLINSKGPYVLFEFEEDNWSKEKGGNKVKLEIYEDVKELGDSKVDGKNVGSKVDDNKSDIKDDNPLLTCKPYNPTFNINPLPTLKESFSNSLNPVLKL
ncbi:beta-adaptin [Nosema bombycis CQ1]|uniref:Beta-adaptin n=1 Tax=Nosema bombycis (strain CQ1 / CVCC 102059) TaxID=578461 RepID=R0KP20_NOSB1|nr:beta-adaptin [Nosema bombycis CQ1]|eukprot:EOB12431.1 beta-adaptin [Nosema bombycis CQ1]